MAISQEAFSKMRPATMLLLIAIKTSSTTHIQTLMELLNTTRPKLARLSMEALSSRQKNPCIPAVTQSPVPRPLLTLWMIKQRLWSSPHPPVAHGRRLLLLLQSFKLLKIRTTSSSLSIWCIWNKTKDDVPFTHLRRIILSKRPIPSLITLAAPLASSKSCSRLLKSVSLRLQARHFRILWKIPWPQDRQNQWVLWVSTLQMG